MDATHDVEADPLEQLRQGISQSSKVLERDVERLHDAVLQGADRVREVLYAPDFVKKRPLGACLLALGTGFLVSRRVSRRRADVATGQVVNAAQRSGLRDIGFALATRLVTILLSRGGRM